MTSQPRARARMVVSLLSLCVLGAAPTSAQPGEGEAAFTVEPLAGVAVVRPGVGGYVWSSEHRRQPAFGLRGLFRLAFDQHVVAEVVVFGGSDDGGADFVEDERLRTVVATVGLSSTLVDRNATGGRGLRMMVGVGALFSRLEQTWREPYAPGGPRTQRYENNGASPAASAALVLEQELTRHVLLRATGSLYGAWRVRRTDDFENGLWWPGASLVAGVAFDL